MPPIHHRLFRSLDYPGSPLTRHGQSRDEKQPNGEEEDDDAEPENVYESDSD